MSPIAMLGSMRVLLFISLLLISMTGHGRQLVLIQGYLSDSSSWQAAGITQQLRQQGWIFNGEYHYSSDGVRLYSRSTESRHSPPPNAYYQVSLPTEASIAKQAFYLKAYLAHLRKSYPQQPISLVGHSAGGIVARYVMVRNPELKVGQLITIASPHLGTDSAEFGKMAGDSPLHCLHRCSVPVP